jgi:putative transposase
MCRAAGVSRAGYYRELLEREADEETMQVRNAIQEIALRHHRRYGYRRVTFELRHQGMCVNHKRVVRLMREDNLLAIGRRAWVGTTESSHEEQVFLNLAGRITPDGVNQLWVADLTYIRLAHEFVYLAVVIDRYSRLVVGWSVGQNLSVSLAVKALREAVARRAPLPGLVHHSDRGFQYCSREYMALLKEHQIIPSMSRPANPYDNAFCESFMRTLKREEIECHQYRDLADLTTHLEQFVDVYYNRQRLHSALGYRTPEEFEKACAAGSPAAARMSFFRHEEIYRSDVAKK